MDEGKSLERMIAFDGSVHMDATLFAGMALDESRRIDDSELVAIFENFDAIGGRNRHNREHRPVRLPAFGAPASVVVGDVAVDLDLHGIAGAFADKRASRKGRIGCLETGIE
jgi:hypothetical protein